MKNLILLIAQICLFLVVFLAGSLLDPFHLRWFAAPVSATATRFFVPDGLILMGALYVLLLVIEVARGKVARAGVWTSAAFLLALVIGLLAKFGMVTHDLY